MTETVAKKEDTFAKKVEMAKLGAEAVVKKVELAKVHKYSSTVHCGQHCDKYFVCYLLVIILTELPCWLGTCFF